MRRGKFQIHEGRDSNGFPHFWWVYTAGNGEIVTVSETYTSKQAARKGIASVKRGALLARVVDMGTGYEDE